MIAILLARMIYHEKQIKSINSIIKFLVVPHE